MYSIQHRHHIASEPRQIWSDHPLSRTLVLPPGGVILLSFGQGSWVEIPLGRDRKTTWDWGKANPRGRRPAAKTKEVTRTIRRVQRNCTDASRVPRTPTQTERSRWVSTDGSCLPQATNLLASPVSTSNNYLLDATLHAFFVRCVQPDTTWLAADRVQQYCITHSQVCQNPIL